MSNKIIESANFAKKAHANQFRKWTGRPYIEHPARVAMKIMLAQHTTEDVVAAAWLHDVIEDCGVTREEIAWDFGVRVAEIVVGLTNTSKLTHPTANRAERKAMDLSRIAAVDDGDVHDLKCIDRIDNLRELRGASPDFIRTYLNESQSLLEVLRHAGYDLKSELAETIHKVRLSMLSMPSMSS